MNKTPDPLLLFSWLEDRIGVAAEDEQAIADLYASLYPDRPRIHEGDVWEMLGSAKLLLGRDPATKRIVAMATYLRLRLLGETCVKMYDIAFTKVATEGGSTEPPRGYPTALLLEVIRRARAEEATSIELRNGAHRSEATRQLGFLGQDAYNLIYEISS